MNFASKLKLIRTTKGLTQSEFAEAIGISRANLANIELGNVKPTKIFINCVCLTYNINKTWLMDDKDNSFNGLMNTQNIPNLISEKYDQLDDTFKKFIEKQIYELLDIQSQKE